MRISKTGKWYKVLLAQITHFNVNHKCAPLSSSLQAGRHALLLAVAAAAAAAAAHSAVTHSVSSVYASLYCFIRPCITDTMALYC